MYVSAYLHAGDCIYNTICLCVCVCIYAYMCVSVYNMFVYVIC